MSIYEKSGELMIIGIGTDIIEISRVEKACDNPKFIEKCYTEKEIAFIGSRTESLAGNFAVKEAVSKALGTGFRGFALRDIECLRDKLGKPYVVLHGGALERFESIGGKNILVSISHSKSDAIAFVIIEG